MAATGGAQWIIRVEFIFQVTGNLGDGMSTRFESKNSDGLRWLALLGNNESVWPR